MIFNYKKLLNIEIPKDFEPVVQEQVEKTLLRAINGLEIAIKKDIRPASNGNKKLLYQEKYISLYHYLPKNENIYSIPIILVPPLMVATDIFDLVPEHSFVNLLLENGFNVYLVDFGKPDITDAHLKIDDYVLNFLYRAVHMSKKHANAEYMTMLGYCLGGSFSTMYASVSIDIKNDIKNVINIAGPIDLNYLPFFNLLFKPFKKEWFALVDKYGGLPKELTTFIFKIADPLSYIRRPLQVINKAWDRDFLVKYQALNGFFNSFQSLPAATFKQCFELISTNDLILGKLKLLDQNINLSNLKASYLAFGGSRDTFIPPDSVRAIQKHISSKDFQYMEFPFGHLSIMGSEKAKDTVWKTCVDWLKVRSGKLVGRDEINHVSTST